MTTMNTYTGFNEWSVLNTNPTANGFAIGRDMQALSPLLPEADGRLYLAVSRTPQIGSVKQRLPFDIYRTEPSGGVWFEARVEHQQEWVGITVFSESGYTWMSREARPDVVLSGTGLDEFLTAMDTAREKASYFVKSRAGMAGLAEWEKELLGGW